MPDSFWGELYLWTHITHDNNFFGLTGKSGRGLLEGKEASATIHIAAGDFAETILGRLDVLEAVKKGQIRVTGSLLSLAKLRFLLQFK